MSYNRILDEQAIGDLILCDPITKSGKDALTRLQLTAKDISPTYFYENLRVASRYEKPKKHKSVSYNQMYNNLYYQYSVDFVKFKLISEQLQKFNSRFISNLPEEYPLLILGVAGNGKSIEINRRVREIISGETDFECGKAYFNLEYAFSKKTYGVTYKCPENSPLWLFCIKLLDGIMQYIKHCHLLCLTILKNFNSIIANENLANEEQKKLFKNIGNYSLSDKDTETEVFRSLISMLSLQQADDDIETLFEILMLIMYCSAPDKKHYIIIDNIEQYIKLNHAQIQIPDSDISTIYKTINQTITNLIDDFNRIEEDLGWKAFKIIIVLRRTSIGLLDSSFLQAPFQKNENINDITGHFQVPDIWDKKKQFIWEEKLCEKFNNSENNKIINIVDIIMGDGKQAIGTDYQLIIASLMSYGIRRNARSQAHAAYKIYEMLYNGDSETINYDEFDKIMSASSKTNSSTRYMFRRALIEFQFKWAISSGNQERWKKLSIGHLTGKRDYIYTNRKMTIECVGYYNPQCVTLVRRVLTYLSYFPDTNNIYDNSKGKSLVDMFSTLSLYDLIEGVLINPSGNNTILDEDFLQLARVLIALSDMSNGDTRSAPYIILLVKDENFHMNTYESVLGELLKKIWQAGRSKSLPGEIYNCSDFGVRINDAGYSFLLDWQASFSFIASMHCFTIPSLFFLKDINSIKYVIKTVYNASLELCQKYEREASRFCGNNITLKSGKYLPQHNNEYITFKQRVKDLHTNHLLLYREFIENNYIILNISQRDMIDLTSHNSGFISRYINEYGKWETGKGAPECF